MQVFGSGLQILTGSAGAQGRGRSQWMQSTTS
jgi:hypothetical protein